MVITASVRPGRLKKGITETKLGGILHLTPCLSEMVGRIELSAEKREEFLFFSAMYRVLTGVGKIVITDAKGRQFSCTNP